MTSEGDLVVHRCEVLGLPLPTTLTFLPFNLFAAESVDELAFSKLTPDLERALADGGHEVEYVFDRSSRGYIEQRGGEWLLPLLLFGAGTELPAIQVALNVLGNYLYDRMKRLKVQATVKMSLVHQADGRYEKLDYEGPVEGLKVLSGWHKGEADGDPGEDS